MSQLVSPGPECPPPALPDMSATSPVRPKYAEHNGNFQSQKTKFTFSAGGDVTKWCG